MVQGLRTVLAAGATALLAFAPVPAAGQYTTAPRQEIPSNAAQGQAAQNQAAQPQAPLAATPLSAVFAAAACLVASDAAAGPALLATAPYSTAERDQAIRTIRGAERCGERRIQIATSALVMRGALVEAMYESAFPQPATPHNPAVAPASWFRPADANARQDASALSPTFALGECTAAAQPGLVHALLATEPETDAETAATTALNPAFSRCVTRGQSIQVDRAGLRAILAESLYRWSVVQRDGQSSPMAAPAAPPATPPAS